MDPLQVRAQAMRTAQDGAPARGWRQRDVRRAIAAAGQAGLTDYRIEIYPDGTIAIVVGDPARSSPEPDNYADLKRP